MERSHLIPTWKIFGNDEKTLDEAILATGTDLYYNGEKIGQVILFGSIGPWGENPLRMSLDTEAVSIIGILMGPDTYEDFLLIQAPENYTRITNPDVVFELATDLNLDGVVDLAEGNLFFELTYSYYDLAFVGKTLKEMVSTSNGNYPTYEEIFNMDKVITKLPMDLRK